MIERVSYYIFKIQHNYIKYIIINLILEKINNNINI